VKYSQAVQHDGMHIRLFNGCKVEVKCSVEWKLTCTTQDGPESESTAAEELALPQAARGSVFASADDCGEDEGWEVDHVRWTCTAGAG
jgi:hypothetical protein